MAINKKPVKAVKKVQPKKVAKPATKKVVAKKAAPAKPVKKDSPKKHTPVVKKSAASPSKSAHVKAVVPAKKVAIATPASKKPAAATTPAKKPAAPAHPVKPSPVAHVPQAVKPVQPVVAKAVKTEDKTPAFKQQVKNTSPVTVKPEPKKNRPQHP